MEADLLFCLLKLHQFGEFRRGWLYLDSSKSSDAMERRLIGAKLIERCSSEGLNPPVYKAHRSGTHIRLTKEGHSVAHLAIQCLPYKLIGQKKYLLAPNY